MENILILDDEKNYLLILEDLLSEEGYQVATAFHGGAKSLEIVSEFDLDVVITDMRMPGMDGKAFLERVPTIRIPISPSS